MVDNDPIAIIQRGADHVAKILTEDQQDNDTPMQAGEAEHDGITATGEIFAYCLGPERDLVPAELLAAIARFADAVVRIEEETDAADAEFEAVLEQERANKEALDGAEAFTVRITRTTVVRVVNVGPYDFLFQAQQAADYYRAAATRVEGAQDATVEVLPYDADQPHRTGMLPLDAAQVAGLMATDDQEAGDFPDLYARFAALHGQDAPRAWRRACNIYDASAEPA